MAAGTGLTNTFSWKDIEVVNDKLGKPHIELHGSLRGTFKEVKLLLSLSHSESHVVAMVVLEEES